MSTLIVKLKKQTLIDVQILHLHGWIWKLQDSTEHDDLKTYSTNNRKISLIHVLVLGHECRFEKSMLMESAGTTNTNGQTQARSPENYNRKEVVVMKTLEQAYADFNFENMVQEHLVGSAENINAYTECCGRYLGQNGFVA